MDILVAVGERIRLLRKGQNLSQEKLSEKAGISAPFLGFVERGQKQVTLVTLKSIADALGVDVAVLFEGCTAKGTKSPTETEILALTNAARTMALEDLKFMRKMAERLAKRG
jgi:transcriptional regulator with XRE-family HTH domain